MATSSHPPFIRHSSAIWRRRRYNRARYLSASSAIPPYFYLIDQNNYRGFTSFPNAAKHAIYGGMADELHKCHAANEINLRQMADGLADVADGDFLA
jgi:hypothetical protein